MELFHLLNRGVDKRSIFLDTQDYARFVHDLYEFNDDKPAGSTYHSFANLDLRSPEIKQRREKIVDIHGWCLMKNHYHLLLSERVEGGITKFIRKLNVGYAKYFNERYGRVGTLFQGRTKKVHINTDRQFLYILHYLHLNPLDYSNGSKNWRDGKISNAEDALEQLTKYRWSSFLDYTGRKNFPSVLTSSLFGKVYKNYQKEVGEFLRDMKKSELERLAILE